MRSHCLETLFSPTSIAVIGASDKANSVGKKVFKNLLQAGFQGNIFAINPKHHEIQNHPCYASVNAVQEKIDLAVIATPAKTVPAIIAECGEKGIQTVIVLSAGFSEIGKEGKTLQDAMLAAAQQHNVRIIGPNCLGVMRPHINMNATFDNNFALPGSIAFVSQSGALSASILDWAMNKKIGFSAIVSLGNNADLDFGDVLDYLAADEYTQSIMLYIEGIRNTRHFMSALRAASKVKPVVVIKSGRNSQGSHAALSHTGALIGSDDVFDVALRRAGAVRVLQIEDLFTASEILSSSCRVNGNRLAIVTNGGGAGVMAADRASELNINLSALNEDMIAKLDKVLPSQWSHQNPIDIIGDAPPERYHAALDICKKDDDVDGILAILVPVAMANPLKVAKQVIKDSKENHKLILACWMGEKHVKSSWKLFEKNQVPFFATPEKAVEAFSYLADYHENQRLLMQVYAPHRQTAKPNLERVHALFAKALMEKRTLLTASETKTILQLFEIPAVETIEATTVDAASAAAKTLGFPVVMKINSVDITHKSQAGGVYLNLNSESDVQTAFAELMTKIKKNYPKANILGVTVESQHQNKFDREIMVGVLRDKVFGPVISFGTGGSLVEILHDRELALPPLNAFLAERLLTNAKILKLGGKLHALSELQKNNIVKILLNISAMVCELPQIQEMDINPFILTDDGMIAVDARMVIAEVAPDFIPYSHLAIQPDSADSV